LSRFDRIILDARADTPVTVARPRTRAARGNSRATP
jgi:hypothetical protein